MKTLIVGVGGMTNGGKSTLAKSLHQQIPNSCIVAQDSYFKEDSVVPVDDNGFKQYDRPLNELFDKRYFMEIPYDDCKKRRSSRVYTPPDPPGYFEGHVWPMYLKNRRTMELTVSGIVFLDGLVPKEELLATVCNDVCQEVERLREKD